MDNVVYKINATDNVATALTSFKHGETANIRGAEDGVIDANEEIHIGHKIALSFIAQGAPIVKYGISIGTATQDIRPGDWVHLHVMCSNYDRRSASLDVVTGAPKDIKYE
ncbi:UxaA family hydrolase [Citrobacter braakii]|jgi:altronate hydrolase/altronate dehydratase small subunit|uniref:UxaA family hydrolase n=1 Tax=Citrobacter braakii TaxID=57706 RepID=UPI001A2FBEE0|nr:hydrolase [Citrobacter braakii]HAT8002450.1 hydrolase [Citrobacter braakii]HCB1520649.1 UxaA family hydrolase [Citrobacter braakii]HCB1526028.1 UxaA family hydrolase [Citrobacter braakii]